MKRSEIVNEIIHILDMEAEVLCYPFLAELILNTLETKGMLPPYTDDLGNNWEPEEVETPYGKSVVEQVNAKIKELNRIVDILKENDVI